MNTSPLTPEEIDSIESFSYESYLAEQQRRAAQTFAVGDIVRLAEDVGTKAQRALVWRVEALAPVQGRTDYSIVPVKGGRGLRAQVTHLDPASEQEKALYGNAPAAPKLHPGMVVEVAARLRGEVEGQRFVVLATNTDGTVKIARLGGDGGRYFPKVAIAACRIVTL